MSAIIQKGDAYYIKCKVAFGETTITPDTCEAIRFAVDNKRYAESEVEFDSDSSMWLIPIAQEQTLGGGKSLSVQAQCKVGSDILTTQVVSVPMRDSIFDDVWEG